MSVFKSLYVIADSNGLYSLFNLVNVLVCLVL
jgi:hypothetical protein